VELLFQFRHLKDSIPFLVAHLRKGTTLKLSSALCPLFVPVPGVQYGPGLVSYEPDLAASYRETGVLVGRMLKGEKPSDLPVTWPTKFELIIEGARHRGTDLDAIARRRGDRMRLTLQRMSPEFGPGAERKGA